MITWTESARTRLESHLNQMSGSLLAAGADPSEVTDDLRRHIDHEAHTRKVGVVTTEDVERILGAMGLPGRISPFTAPTTHPVGEQKRGVARLAPTSAATPPSPPALSERKWHRTLLAFGVVLPTITLCIELLTHMCAASFFDPIPDLWHVLLVASVPVMNFLAWRAIHLQRATALRWLGLANAFALGVGIYYSLLFVTLAPFALFAVLLFGWGLLPLSPIFALASTCRLRVLLGRLQPTETQRPAGGLAWGLSAAGIVLSLLVLPPVLTRHWARIASSDESSSRATALKRLRSFGHEKTLLADCYGTTRWASENPFRFHAQGTPVPVEAARAVFYQVTGRAFNEFPPPQLGYKTRGWDAFDQFSWDPDQGGTQVGGRLRGLSMAQSRLDALVDGNAGWAYTEWILEFKNVADAEREARAQIALPPGGVVSRLTLWVNGEEREGAFAGTSQVRAAYENVVKVLRRDPVLVTSSGKDRVLMQCYPVPANGGTIKVRLGITSPVMLENETRGVVRWPHFVERNFAIPEGVTHSAWVESMDLVQSNGSNLITDRSKPGVFALRGPLLESELADAAMSIRVTRTANARPAWVPDMHSAGTHWIQQTLTGRAVKPPDRIIMVVDGSRPMARSIPEIADALAHLPAGVDFALLVAQDGVVDLSEGPRQWDGNESQRLARRLRQLPTSGGQDNIPALLRAWDFASERANSLVLWLHGPQPVELGNSASFQQRLDWNRPDNGSAPKLLEVQCGLGLNRLSEAMAGLSVVQSLPRFGALGKDLKRTFAQWRGDLKEPVWVRERLPVIAGGEETRGGKNSKHLARLWANDEILRLIVAKKREEAIALAGRYQLVTPVSGAVVLETLQQFQQAGLTPVGADTVPTVPEPGGVALLVLAGLAACIWRLRHQRRHHQRAPRV